MQNNRKIIYGILISVVALSAIFAFIIFSNQKNVLQIVFLDVGQGDAILISEGSNQILIDGGKDGKLLLEKLGKYIPFWDRNIETIIATHPDQDHIGGLIDLFKAYRVQNIIKTNAQSESQTFKKLEEEIAAEGAEKIEAKKDVTIKFSNGAIATILFPVDSLPEAVDNASNDNSVVVKLMYGENSFLFTGDLPTTNESEIISKNIDIKSAVLKVSHHGSKYATSNEFLDITKPSEAIISVGKNSYGHPNQEVLDRLLQNGIKIFRTDEISDIIYKCVNLEARCSKVAN